MDLTDVRSNVFFGSEVYYDLDERNYIVLDMQNEDEDMSEEEKELA